jgi:pilus assembly protein CpaE
MGKPNKPEEKQPISIILVDDIAETRDSIKKLLAFESDFKVIDTAGNGREGVQKAIERKPDIVIMDINMPDMDGLEAASRITKAVPTVGVIMMSVQDDADYMQKAMLAGARFFLTKPVNMDQLYNTIRNVHQQYELIRRQFAALNDGRIQIPTELDDKKNGDRAGNILVVYSPQGGTGKTTIATSLASGLMKEGIKTLLVDASLEFGDCGAFLDLRPQVKAGQTQTIMDIIENADDLDAEYFDGVVMTHNSGLKVLLAPPNPTMGSEVRDTNPGAVATILEKIAPYYDFIVVDTGVSIDAVNAPLLQIATKIILVTVPTLPATKNARLVLKMFKNAEFPMDKIAVVLNRAVEKPTAAQKNLYPPEKIQQFLDRPVEGIIPLVDENFILEAIRRGVPVIASDRDVNRAPIKQLQKFSDHLYNTLMGEEEKAEAIPGNRGGILGGFFGGTKNDGKK